MELAALEAELRQALILAFFLSAVLLVPSFLVGVMSGVFQALTSIQDQILAFAPKALVVGLLLFFLSGWMLSEIQEFMDDIFRIAQQAGGSG